MNQPTQNVVQIPANTLSEPNELTLLDLLKIIFDHKLLILAGTLVFIIAGAYFSHQRPILVEYKTAVSVGTIYDYDAKGINRYSLEPTKSLLTKLNESYIPQSVIRYAEANGDQYSGFGVIAEVPKDSEDGSIVILKSTGLQKDSEAYKSIHAGITEQIEQDHREIAQIEKSRINFRIMELTTKLNELEDPAKTLSFKKGLEYDHLKLQLELDVLKDDNRREIERLKIENSLKEAQRSYEALLDTGKLYKVQLSELDDKRARLEKEIKDTRMEIERLISVVEPVYKQPGSEQQLLTFLMMENSIERKQSKLQQLETQLIEGLPDERLSLIKAINQNNIDLTKHQENMKLFEARLIQQKSDYERALKEAEPRLPLSKLAIEQANSNHERNIAHLKQQIAFLNDQIDSIKLTTALSKPLTLPANQVNPYFIIGAFAVIGLIVMVVLSLLIRLCQTLKQNDIIA